MLRASCIAGTAIDKDGINVGEVALDSGIITSVLVQMIDKTTVRHVWSTDKPVDILSPPSKNSDVSKYLTLLYLYL